jgi:nucleoredoxin
MPWIAIPFGDTRIEEITTKHGVKGIPVLLILKPNGDVITKLGK